MSNRARLALLPAVLLVATACAGTGATQPPSLPPASEAPASEAPTEAPESEAPTEAPESEAPASASPAASPSEPATSGPVCENLPAEAEGDLLATICERGTIVMSTDPQYPPQSELTPDGEYVGFDIDVGREIAERLGVELAFETPAWEVLTAGGWGGRWDFSVGSMTITSQRQEILDFTQPYYFTPAQMAAHADAGITDLDGFAGKTVCVGAATTYLDWLNGTLDFGTESPETQPPEGVQATTLDTDRFCADAWGSGRRDFDGWLSSSTTVQDAIADGLPVVAVGEPVFYEPLAAALDKSAPDHDQLLEAIDGIIGEMHADGTLSELSEEWFGADLTVREDA